MEYLKIQDLLSFFSSFHKLFDIVRVIEPEKKEVVYFDDGGETHRSVCYDFWKRRTHCSNCVSARAMAEKDTFIKIEYHEYKVFLILASPVRLKDGEYIVEMLKDITETGLITNLSGKSIKETNNLISDLNIKTIMDELTDCYNRRYINERLPADIYNATLNKEKLSVLMLDLDFFKNINDLYGHIVGDLVLKELAKTIKQKIRKNFDWLARFGGEEFLVVLQDVGQETAYKTAEKIRLAWESKAITHKQSPIKTTVSIGAYTVKPGTKKFTEILELVDENLYKAKDTGRNKTIIS